MIKIIENDIIQNGTKIGYIKSDDIYNTNGDKIGSYLGNDILIIIEIKSDISKEIILNMITEINQ